MKEEGTPRSSVADSSREASSVIATAKTMRAVSSQGAYQRAAAACEKHGYDGYEGGKAAVTWHQAVGYYGYQPFPGRVYYAAARYAHSVAAKAHAGGEGLLSAGVAALEAAVKVEGDAGQIPQVLQKSEKRKEYGHGRQHYGDYPRQYPVYSEKQRLVYKFRYRCGSAKSDELILNFEKYVRKQL